MELGVKGKGTVLSDVFSWVCSSIMFSVQELRQERAHLM